MIDLSKLVSGRLRSVRSPPPLRGGVGGGDPQAPSSRAYPPTPNPPPAREEGETLTPPCLSRTAENLYWLARYVERAEYLARTIDATLRVDRAAGRLYRQDQ